MQPSLPDEKSRGLEAPVAAAQAVRNAITMPFDEALRPSAGPSCSRFGRPVACAAPPVLAEREAAKVDGIGKGRLFAGEEGWGHRRWPDGRQHRHGLRQWRLRGRRTRHERRGARPQLRQHREDLRVFRRAPFAIGRGQQNRLLHLAAPQTTARSPIATSSSRPCSRTWRSSTTSSASSTGGEAGAVLATNTSISTSTDRCRDQPAAGRARPHFFSPANVMKLLEIVRGKPRRM